MPTIDYLPDPPNRTMSQEEFDAAVDALLAAFPTFITQTNAAAAAYGVTMWVSGTTYAQGDRVWSPTDFQTYRRKTNGAGTTDPSADSTNWASITSISALMLGASALGRSPTFINGTLVHSRTGNAETIAVKTYAGTDPSATNPVLVIFRSATAATGDYTVLSITAATSITINNTATMGATNGVAFRLWVVGFNDGGTFRLGVINCLSGTNIYPLGSGHAIASSTAMGTGADSAHVFYTGSAVTSKPYMVLGFSTWESGLAAVGVWDTAPTRTQLFGPGVPLPGSVIQTARTETGAVSTGSTVLPHDDTIPQNTEGNEFLTQAITPTSAANVLDISSRLHLGTSSSDSFLVAALFQDSVADALNVSAAPGAGSNFVWDVALNHRMLAGTTSATTLKMRAGQNGAATITLNGHSSARRYGGRLLSHLAIGELMA